MPEPETLTEDEKPTHRLTRMTVQEVSLVDRAANKRRFLVTKREEPMKAKPVKKEDAATAAANVADDNASGGDSSAAAGGTAMQQQIKEGLTAALSAAAEKIVAIAQEVDAMPVTDQTTEPAVPESVTKQLAEVVAMCSDIASKFGGAVAAGASSGESAANATPAPDPTTTKATDEEKEPTDQEKSAVDDAEKETAEKGLNAEANADLVAKSVAARLGLALPAAQSLVKRVQLAKVGRRMAKQRLETFMKALDMLLGIAKELRYDAEKSAAAAAAARKATAGAVEKSAAPDMALVDELVKSAESMVEIAKAKDAEIVSVRAELAKANERIASLEKVTAGSNVLPVDGGGSRPNGGVYWPLDLNSKKQPAHR